MLRGLRTCLGHLFVCFVVLTLGPRGVAAQAPVPRLALVVGNAAYADMPLPTAANDAGLVARALSQTGFSVTAAGDADRVRLDAVFESFAARLKAAGPETVVVVYLAGYGLQFSGDNYLVPIGAKITRDVDVPGAAISVSALRRQLEALPAKARILIDDLARENPFARDGTRLAGGLALVQPTASTLIAFNMAPGMVAAPDVAPYGAYARALSEAIVTPGLGLPALFERVRLRVSMATAGATLPWTSGTIADDVTLSAAGPALRGTSVEGRPVDVSSVDQAYVAAVARDTLDGYLAFLKGYPAEPLAARVRTLAAVRREALLWAETVRLGSDRSYWTYMRRYPRGPHVPDARRGLLALHAPLDPPPRFEIVAFASAALPSPAEVSLLDRPSLGLDDAAWPPVPATADTLPPPAASDELPPPPLTADGILPVADPIAGARAESAPITQPIVPSGPAIVAYTSFVPGGGWIVDSKADGRTIERTVMTPGPNGDRTIVQTGPDGAVTSRTTIVHDKAGTTIVQTGPSGGILTKSVTRADGAGGRSTVLTTGGNQLIAIVQVDRQGVTAVKRGPAALPAPSRPGAAAQVAIPPDPPAPPPLTMPTASLPSPAPAQPASPVKGTETKTPDAKTVEAKTVEAKTVEATPADPNAPDRAAAEIVPLDPAAHLPLIAPLPPRRAVAASRPDPAPRNRSAKRAAPPSRGKAPAPKRRR